ncbi:hypothetical protein ACFSMW_13465 [Virgibacillus halophilus]|uniref:Phage portal protein, SPP1 Gp6-like n=1 Tax=Tigheibacillus halophilus TaxID=361280 RepID=A0ABU5C7X3_9BACI|nr:hypothetical protein [Virgibacillus halophilus]
MPNWTKFDADVIKKTHGDIFYYRDLYEGKHSEIFPRAKELIKKGEIIDNIMYGTQHAQNVQTPYIVANICKLIPEIPAMLVSRSIGNIQSSLSPDDFQADEINQDTDEIVDNPRDDVSEIIHVQQEVINQIQKNSNLAFEHWGNILQQQVDGGLVGVPWMDDRGLRLEFKARDVYYPHEDGMGADLAYEIEINDEEYLRIYREEIKDGDLHTGHLLYKLNDSKKTEEVPEDETKELLGIKELEKVYPGRGRLFIIYWPNEKTFMNPLGTSCLKGQDGKQDEVNWTLTRNAITFERNGKPRIAVSKEIMEALESKAMERYGDDARIDHRDLEITTFDENGKAMEIIQIDVTKIGDIQWVKDLMKLMLMETKTSEKVIDFYMDNNNNSGSQSGVAKFYDLFTSLVKAEQIQSEYIYFLQQLIESALWLANFNDDAVVIEEPEIMLKSMIPISRKELIEENNKAYQDETQSLETTIRRNNPNASEEWIQEELARVEAERSGDDSFSLMRGRQTLQQFRNNRDENGDPIQEDEE